MYPPAIRSVHLRQIPLQTVALFVVVFAALAFVSDLTRVRALEHYEATQQYEDVYYVPAPSSLRLMSFGYREALAGLLWCRALVYFGEELLHKGGIQNIFNYADAVIALDPYFRRVYQWAGTAGIYRPKGVGLPELRRAGEYLETAMRLFPDDGELAWDAGATLEFELKPYLTDAREIEETHARAMRYLQTAARLGKGPPWLVLTNATALTKLGKNEQAVRHLEEMYATVQDRSTKLEIGRQIARLKSQNELEALDRTIAELEKNRQRDFPYVSPGLHMLLGKRPPLDVNDALARRFRPLDAAIQTTD